jgi:PAS domain S-box-containing protein
MLSNVAAILVLWIHPDRLYREDVLPLARESIINNMLDSVILVDAMDRILYMNPAAIELGGVESEIEGMTISEIWPDLMEQLNLHSGLVGQEVVFENEDVKHTYDASVSTMRNTAMNVTNRIVVLKDITEHRKYSETLEKLVSERTMQLRKAERLATIGETATMVGHDLRNPLQVIVGYTQFLSSMLSKEKLALGEYPEPEKIIDIVEILSNQTYYMNKIVSDLQDYARPINPEWTSTEVTSIFDEVLSTIDHTDIKIEKAFPESCNSLVDPDLIRRLLTNLISNAVQAMPDGGKLRLVCCTVGGDMKLSVEDTGVGIPPENLPKLFKPLFTTKPKGTGFGLAVCKKLVDAHGGRIEVNSKVGVGTTFTVLLPKKNEVLDI